MSERLKKLAIKAGYGDGMGSQILTRVDELELRLAAALARADAAERVLRAN